MKFYRICYRGYADVEADNEEEAVDRYLDDPSCACDDDLDITNSFWKRQKKKPFLTKRLPGPRHGRRSSRKYTNCNKER